MIPRSKAVKRMGKGTGSRPGSRGHRNAENSRRDRNDNQEITSSGKAIGKRERTAKAPARQQNRGQQFASGRKRPRSHSEERDSTRVQARGNKPKSASRGA